MTKNDDTKPKKDLLSESSQDRRARQILIYILVIMFMCACVANLFDTAADVCVAARQVNDRDVFTNIICLPIMLFTGTKDSPEKETTKADESDKHTIPTSIYVQERSTSRINAVSNPIRTVRTTILLLSFTACGLIIWQVIKPTKKEKKRKKKKLKITPQELKALKLTKSVDNTKKTEFKIK